MNATYLVAVVDTNREGGPSATTVRSGLTAAEARSWLQAAIDAHGRGRDYNDAQMLQEAETADTLLRRWRGGPERYCGYLVRYDVYPDAIDWASGAAIYDHRKARIRAHGALDRMAVPSDDPSRTRAVTWMTEQLQDGRTEVMRRLVGSARSQVADGWPLGDQFGMAAGNPGVPLRWALAVAGRLPVDAAASAWRFRADDYVAVEGAS